MTPETAIEETHPITSRFAPFVMSDGEFEGTDEAWMTYQRTTLALGEALVELHGFFDLRRELEMLLEESGFHVVARLRKQTDLRLIGDDEFDEMLERLISAGMEELAHKAAASRDWFTTATREAPKASMEKRRELLAKLERLSTTNNPIEAATVRGIAEQIKTKYEIDSSDEFDFDLEDLKAPIVLTPVATLAIAIDAAWAKLQPLGDFYYGLMEDPEKMRRRMQERARWLEKLVREYTMLKPSTPIVHKRRRH